MRCASACVGKSEQLQSSASQEYSKVVFGGGWIVLIGAADPVTENDSTGCNSIALGATPVWPCLKSKKPTPVRVTVPEIVVKCDEDGCPKAAVSVALASRISPAWPEATAPSQSV